MTERESLSRTEPNLSLCKRHSQPYALIEMGSPARFTRNAWTPAMPLFTLWVLIVLASAAGRQAPAVADVPSGQVLVRQMTLGAIAVRPDGAIVVAGRTVDCPPDGPSFSVCPGRRTYLVEFDRHGHLVPGFGSALPTWRLGGVFALAIGPEGDVFLAGKGGRGAHLSRFDRQGHLDPSFGVGGRFTIKEVGDRIFPAIKAFAVEPDGAVVAAGIVRTEKGWPEVFLLRLRPDGSLDPSFGDGGKVLSPSTLGGRLGPSKVEALALTGDGRIVVAGSTEFTEKTRSALFAARYLQDGQADLSFGGDGQSAIAVSKRGRTYTEGLAVLPSEEVVLAGSDNTRPDTFSSCVQPVVAHLLGDGRPDPAFGGRNGEEPGVLRVGSRSDGPCRVQATSVLGDGSVTFALATDGESPLYLDRLALDGTRDPGFASADSAALPPLASGYLWHFRLAAGGQVTAAETVRPRCRPVSGGTKTGFPCHSVLLVARDAQGRLRRGFGRDGGVVLRLPRQLSRRAEGMDLTKATATRHGRYGPAPPTQ